MSDVQSRPKWDKLDPREEASMHLVCSDGTGMAAVARAFAERPHLLPRTTIVHTAPMGAVLPESLAGATQHALPSRATTLRAFSAHLGRAKMGTQVHLAGSEAFLNEASGIVAACGVLGDGLTTELCGASTRRVQCVHCKGMMDEVAVSPVACSHCGINLLVRDHYSRRLGAFMGVCIDAEAPGELPLAAGF